MANEKRIRVSLDDDVSGKVGRLGQNTASAMENIADAYEGIDDVIDGLISDSEKYNLSIKERIRWVEKEIQTQQRNSKVDHLDRKNKLDHERRLGQEKQTWHKKDENIFRKKRSWIDTERREELAYYEKMKLRANEKLSGLKGDEKSKEEDGGGGSGGSSRGSGFVGRLSGGARAAGNGALAAAGFGAILSIAGFVGKMIDESRQLDESSNRLSGMGVTGVGGAAFGLKESALMDYTRNVSKFAGTASASEARDQLAIEKGFGMDIGSTSGFNKAMRLDEHSSLSDATLDMLNIMKKSDLYNIKRGDFTQMHELLERQNTLNELQASQTEEIHARDSSMLMGSLGKVGGSFSDFRQGTTISSMNSAITDPNNDFKQAFLLRTLRQANPDASFLDLKMKQEEGIFGKGTLSGLMSNLSSSFSGEQLTFSISKMLGLNLHQAHKLQGHYAQNPDMFKDLDIKSQEEFDEYLNTGKIGGKFTKETVRKRGEKNTGVIEGWTSEFDSWMAEKGNTGVQYAKGLQTSFDRGGIGALTAKLGSDIVQAIKDGFAAVTPGQGGVAEANYRNPEIQQDVDSVIKNMSQDDFDTFIQQNPAFLKYTMNKSGKDSGGKGNMTTGDAFSDWLLGFLEEKTNTGQSGDYNKAISALLTNFMPEKYAGLSKDGEILKVEVVNQPKPEPKQPKNTTHKPKDN